MVASAKITEIEIKIRKLKSQERHRYSHKGELRNQSEFLVEEHIIQDASLITNFNRIEILL